ncbi:YicC/YloC family endoribonuclease [Tistrella mobilis]
MALASMTGFARADAGDARYGWNWEVKSVNGRSLDLRIRLAPGFDQLEPVVRKVAQDRIRRGHVSVQLGLVTHARGARLRIDPEVADGLGDVLTELQRRFPKAKVPRLDGLLRVPGLLQMVEQEESEAVRAAREHAMTESLIAAFDRLVIARAQEGAALTRLLTEHVDAIEGLVTEAAGLAATQPATIRARLEEQLRSLLQDRAGAAEDRIIQEAAMLAVKADIREELDRLVAHVAQARELMAADEPVGRQLDFLAQEFNREANTLCSKSSDTALTRIGLALKTRIDQLREQIQNVE